jgi:hypothetical protein
MIMMKTSLVALAALLVLGLAAPAAQDSSAHTGRLAGQIASAPVMTHQQGGVGKRTTGVIAVLDFDADWTQNTPNGAVFPGQCQTESHLAGPNEVAIVNMNGFVAASGPSSDFIQLKAAISEDGWPFAPISVYYTIDGLSDGAGHVSTTAKVELIEGVTYVFGAQFQTGAPVVVGFSTCHGTVMVARLAS